MTNQDLVEHLKLHGLLTKSQVLKAFELTDRGDFVPKALKSSAYEDRALPIGSGQSISQPVVVATMLELLDPVPNIKILDIGFGSGYTTALLASAIEESGEIIAIESVPEVAEFGNDNLRKYNFVKQGVVKTITGDGSIGLPAEAPFDRILVSASTDEVPEELISQLKPNGILVIPAKDSLVKIVKKENGEVQSTQFPGYVFVPLVRSK